jgi:hypothetical protein
MPPLQSRRPPQPSLTFPQLAFWSAHVSGMQPDDDEDPPPESCVTKPDVEPPLLPPASSPVGLPKPLSSPDEPQAKMIAAADAMTAT